MFQFGEVLTLVISVVAVAYLLTNWGRIRAAPNLRPFILPLVLMIVAWIATVVEGVFSPGTSGYWVITMQESGGGAETPVAVAFNLVEHGVTVAAVILLLVAVLHLGTRSQEVRR